MGEGVLISVTIVISLMLMAFRFRYLICWKMKKGELLEMFFDLDQVVTRSKGEFIGLVI